MKQLHRDGDGVVVLFDGMGDVTQKSSAPTPSSNSNTPTKQTTESDADGWTPMSAVVHGSSLGWGGVSPLELESGPGHDNGTSHKDSGTSWLHLGKKRAGVLGAILLGAILASFYAGRTSCAGGDHGVDVTAPEGSFTDFNATLDWRGRPRSISLPVGGAAVASDHERCGEHGVKVMRAGGNAMDAAVATCLCQGLLNPMASGIGGGTLITVRYVR